MTLQELLDKCRDNINSEAVFQEIVAEHNKQIKAEVIKKYLLKDCNSCEAHLRDLIRAEFIKEIDNLRHQYVDSCNMCTSTKCEDCKIDQFIEDLEKLKEQKGNKCI